VALIENILLRPRMYSEARDLRDLLMFLSGICAGRHAPHGGTGPLGFSDYLEAEGIKPREVPWLRALQERFGDRPYDEARGAILALLRDWWASRHAHDPDAEP
jgi:hypothetical protein